MGGKDVGMMRSLGSFFIKPKISQFDPRFVYFILFVPMALGECGNLYFPAINYRAIVSVMPTAFIFTFRFWAHFFLKSPLLNLTLKPTCRLVLALDSLFLVLASPILGTGFDSWLLSLNPWFLKRPSRLEKNLKGLASRISNLASQKGADSPLPAPPGNGSSKSPPFALLWTLIILLESKPCPPAPLGNLLP